MARNIEVELTFRYLNYIRGRMTVMNKNWLCAVCGDTGSGKSYSALSVADRICPNGIRIENVVFSPLDFMKRLKSGEFKKGDIIIFDEAGVGMSSREWYSIQNKLLGSILQTFRNMNVGVIFTTPNLGFVDKQARTLLHSYMETSRIDRNLKVAYLKIYNVNHYSMWDKTYYNCPRFRCDDRLITMKELAVPMPRISLVKEYEKVKTEYTEKLNAKVLEELNPDKKKKDGRKTSYDYNEMAQKIRDKFGGEKVPLGVIAGTLGIGRNTAQLVKALI